MEPTTIIAQWTNVDRTRSYILEASGVLVTIERDHPSDVWSPPSIVGPLLSGTAAFEQFLHGLAK